MTSSRRNAMITFVIISLVTVIGRWLPGFLYTALDLPSYEYSIMFRFVSYLFGIGVAVIMYILVSRSPNSYKPVDNLFIFTIIQSGIFLFLSLIDFIAGWYAMLEMSNLLNALFFIITVVLLINVLRSEIVHRNAKLALGIHFILISFSRILWIFITLGLFHYMNNWNTFSFMNMVSAVLGTLATWICHGYLIYHLYDNEQVDTTTFEDYEEKEYDFEY